MRSGVAAIQALHSGVAAIHPQALHLEEEDFWILSQRQASEVLSEAEETRRTSVAAVGSHSSSLLTLLPRSSAVAEETTQRAALAAALHSPSSAAAGDFPSSLEEQRVAEDSSALL